MGDVNISELNEGDVLLYRGNSFISKLIILLDGGPYSHASLYHQGHILEALANGITVNPVNVSVAGSESVDVFRFFSNGHVLGDSSLSLTPIIVAANEFEANPQRYAYEEILLLAVLCTTRQLTRILQMPGLVLILRNILDHAAEVVAKLAAAGKEPVICSELVYRIYQQAGAAYRIIIRGADIPALMAAMAAVPGSQEDTAVTAFRRAAQDFVMNYGAFKASARKSDIPVSAAFEDAANLLAAAAVADFVTPHDLASSPNLQRLGTLSV